MAGGRLAHRTVADLAEFVRRGDVLVVNTTRVLPARLRLRKAQRGEVEALLLERGLRAHWEALVRPSRRVRPGTRLAVGPRLDVEVGGEGVGDGTRRVTPRAGRRRRAGGARPLRHRPAAALHPHPAGRPRALDQVFAERLGSVAAPTAGLHHPAGPRSLPAAGAVEPCRTWWAWARSGPCRRPRSKTTTCTPSATWSPPAPWRPASKRGPRAAG